MAESKDTPPAKEKSKVMRIVGIAAGLVVTCGGLAWMASNLAQRTDGTPSSTAAVVEKTTAGMGEPSIAPEVVDKDDAAVTPPPAAPATVAIPPAPPAPTPEPELDAASKADPAKLAAIAAMATKPETAPGENPAAPVTAPAGETPAPPAPAADAAMAEAPPIPATPDGAATPAQASTPEATPAPGVATVTASDPLSPVPAAMAVPLTPEGQPAIDIRSSAPSPGAPSNPIPSFGTDPSKLPISMAAVDEPSPKPIEDMAPKDLRPLGERPAVGPETAGKATDVTASAIAGKHDITGHGDSADDEQDKIDASAPLPSKITSSEIKQKGGNEMPGWELLQYRGRDYVTGSSIQKFYRFHTFKSSGNNVWFSSPQLIMKGTVGSRDLLINDIKFVMSDPLMELNGKPCFSRLDLCKLIDPVLRPSYIGNASSFNTVILDPGHGGHDSGAKGVYGYEKDFTLKLAFVLKAHLEKQGFKVYMTRTTDAFISLHGRVAYANKIPNSIYVSLHYNSGGSAAKGIETFALSPQGSSSVYGARSVDGLAYQGNLRDSENIALATAVHASVVHHFKLVDRGVKRARWAVLKGLQRPGILFEGGFVTNEAECRLIAADNFRTAMAGTITQAIVNYKRALQPRRR